MNAYTLSSRIKYFLPYSLFSWFRTNYITWFIYKTILNTFFVHPNEKIVKYGDNNPDIIYYVHKHDCWDTCGLMSIVTSTVANFEYAASRGYIPVIDMKNAPNSYLYDDEVGMINSWEYYFEQPYENINKELYSLDEAYKSKNVIISHENNIWSHAQDRIYPNIPSFLDLDNKVFQRMRRQFKKFIRLNSAAQEYVNNQYNKIISDKDRVLGVSVRSGGYKYLKPRDHPKQPEVNDVIVKTRQLSDEWHCNKIFVTTDDVDVLNEFKDVFGDLVVYTERPRMRYTLHDDGNGKYLTSEQVPSRNAANEKYLSGLEYLADVNILSRCNCLIGAPCGITFGAALMSDGYEHLYNFNCGVFGVTDKSPVGERTDEGGMGWILKE